MCFRFLTYNPKDATISKKQRAYRHAAAVPSVSSLYRILALLDFALASQRLHPLLHSWLLHSRLTVCILPLPQDLATQDDLSREVEQLRDHRRHGVRSFHEERVFIEERIQRDSWIYNSTRSMANNVVDSSSSSKPMMSGQRRPAEAVRVLFMLVSYRVHELLMIAFWITDCNCFGGIGTSKTNHTRSWKFLNFGFFISIPITWKRYHQHVHN